MACPYFMPIERLENGSWPHPARLPLGAGWCGHCTAQGHEGEVPAQDILEACCNLGYASGCSWAPQERVWDAVRFAVLAPSGNAKRVARHSRSLAPSAAVIRLRYVCERNHLPVTHGDLEFDLLRNAWTSLHDDARLQKMAECFLDSYLKRSRT